MVNNQQFYRKRFRNPSKPRPNVGLYNRTVTVDADRVWLNAQDQRTSLPSRHSIQEGLEAAGIEVIGIRLQFASKQIALDFETTAKAEASKGKPIMVDRQELYLDTGCQYLKLKIEDVPAFIPEDFLREAVSTLPGVKLHRLHRVHTRWHTRVMREEARRNRKPFYELEGGTACATGQVLIDLSMEADAEVPEWLSFRFEDQDDTYELIDRTPIPDWDAPDYNGYNSNPAPGIRQAANVRPTISRNDDRHNKDDRPDRPARSNPPPHSPPTRHVKFKDSTQPNDEEYEEVRRKKGSKQQENIASCRQELVNRFGNAAVELNEQRENTDNTQSEESSPKVTEDPAPPPSVTEEAEQMLSSIAQISPTLSPIAPTPSISVKPKVTDKPASILANGAAGASTSFTTSFQMVNASDIDTTLTSKRTAEDAQLTPPNKGTKFAASTPSQPQLPSQIPSAQRPIAYDTLWTGDSIALEYLKSRDPELRTTFNRTVNNPIACCISGAGLAHLESMISCLGDAHKEQDVSIYNVQWSIERKDKGGWSWPKEEELEDIQQIIVSVGANDITKGYKEDFICERMCVLAARYKEMFPNAKVFWIIPGPRYWRAQGRINDAEAMQHLKTTTKLNQVAKELCSAADNLVPITTPDDGLELMKKEDIKRMLDQCSHDGLHLNYKYMSRILFKLAEYLPIKPSNR